jgi:hypothetical protein
MIFLDICGAVLVGIAVLIYREIRDVARNARALYKTQGLHRF